MAKNIMILMILFLLLTTNALASLTYVAGTTEGVIYDDLNDIYWFSDLSVFANRTFDQQVTFIETLPQNFAYPFNWHMATEQEILALTQSYEPETIASYFKPSYGSYWEGFTNCVSPDISHVIYQIVDYTPVGGLFYIPFNFFQLQTNGGRK